MSMHKLNIHYRGSPRGGRTQQHAYCLRYAHSQHIESHLGKKQQQAKIPIAFLFSQLHFHNITSHALFYGGHLVMRSKRCAVQNWGITLRSVTIPDSSVSCQKLSNVVRKATEQKCSKFVHIHQTSCRAVDDDDPMTPRIW